MPKIYYNNFVILNFLYMNDNLNFPKGELVSLWKENSNGVKVCAFCGQPARYANSGKYREFEMVAMPCSCADAKAATIHNDEVRFRHDEEARQAQEQKKKELHKRLTSSKPVVLTAAEMICITTGLILFVREKNRYSLLEYTEIDTKIRTALGLDWKVTTLDALRNYAKQHGFYTNLRRATEKARHLFTEARAKGPVTEFMSAKILSDLKKEFNLPDVELQ
jgi:hypothetical protein